MAYKRKEIKSFKLYYDMWPQIRELDVSERGRFLTAIFKFLIDGEDDDFKDADRLLRGLWKSTKEKLLSEIDDYNRNSEKQSNNRMSKERQREAETSSTEPP